MASLSTNITNSTISNILTKKDAIGSDDATWILTSAFIIFTMQSGFGLLESGMVSSKNEANIMVKNAIDVIYGGLSYWLFGFALSFGKEGRNNPFCGLGHFLTDVDEHEMGGVYPKYFFQLSFSTTATTIVSGAMAERANLKAYTLFSFLNTVTYCFPAHWIWDDHGWLRKLGAVDIAGCAAVHLVGGMSGLVATLYLKPRAHVFDEKSPPAQMASPTNVLLGTFMLWWGWLGFNCGSTFGISGEKWKLASRSAVVTINGSIGGGIMGMFYSYAFYKGKLNIPVFVTGILGGLVSITAICSIARPWEALLISFIGALIACSGCRMLQKFKIDDPVGCVPVHAFAGIWGLVAVGLFAEQDTLEMQYRSSGIFKGGPMKFLGVQLLAIVSISVWTIIITFLELVFIDKILPLRVSPEDEAIGADRIEHGITHGMSDYTLPDKNNQDSTGIESNEQDEQAISATSKIDSSSYFTRFKERIGCCKRKTFNVNDDKSQTSPWYIQTDEVYAQRNHSFKNDNEEHVTQRYDLST